MFLKWNNNNKSVGFLNLYAAPSVLFVSWVLFLLENRNPTTFLAYKSKTMHRKIFLCLNLSSVTSLKPNEVKPENKTDLEDTKKQLEDMLKDDSYTDEDKKNIQDAIDDR